MSQEQIELGTCEQCKKPNVEIFLSSQKLTIEESNNTKGSFLIKGEGFFGKTKKRCSCCIEENREDFKLWDPKYDRRSSKNEAAA